MNFGLAPEAPRPYYLRIAHQETEEISAPRTPENLVEPIAILSAVRTPIGRFLGSLSDVPAKDLGITAAKAALEQAGVDASEVGQTIFGMGRQAGNGPNPARQVSLGTGVPVEAIAHTVNMACASGLKARG